MERLSGPNLKLALLRRTLLRTLSRRCAVRLIASMTSETRDTISVTVQGGRTPRPRIDDGLALVMEDESDLTPLEDEVETPKKRPRTRRKAPSKNIPVEGSKSRNIHGARKRTTSQVVENATTDSEKVPPKKRKRACKSEPVYIIPDVEKKVTTFRGRLGTKYIFYLAFIWTYFSSQGMLV